METNYDEEDRQHDLNKLEPLCECLSSDGRCDQQHKDIFALSSDEYVFFLPLSKIRRGTRQTASVLHAQKASLS